MRMCCFRLRIRDQAGLTILWILRGVQLVTSLYAAQEAANNLDKEDRQLRLRDLIEKIEIVSNALGVDATTTDRLGGH